MRMGVETYQLLDHVICEGLLLVTVDVQEQERLDFFTKFIQRHHFIRPQLVSIFPMRKSLGLYRLQEVFVLLVALTDIKS
jgi:hypothetical protein